MNAKSITRRERQLIHISGLLQACCSIRAAIRALEDIVDKDLELIYEKPLVYDQNAALEAIFEKLLQEALQLSAQSRAEK